jgi:hypothetical protein
MGDRSDAQCRFHFLQMCRDLRVDVDFFRLSQYQDRFPFWANEIFVDKVKEGYEKALQAGGPPFTEVQKREAARPGGGRRMLGDFVVPDPPVEDLFSSGEPEWTFHTAPSQ